MIALFLFDTVDVALTFAVGITFALRLKVVTTVMTEEAAISIRVDSRVRFRVQVTISWTIH
jgi:hypothetical protein